MAGGNSVWRVIVAPAASRRRLRRPTKCLTLVALLVVSGCGAKAGRTALVANEPQRLGNGQVQVMVECASSVEATVRAGAGVEALPLVTIWGRPRAGRCQIPVRLDLPPETTRFDDAASGMVINIPGR